MGFYPRAHRSTVCSGARCTRCTFMEAFSIKINTEGCLVFSLSLSLFSLFHSRSVSVPSLVGRRLSITLSLSLVPAQNSLLLFFLLLSLSFSLSLSRIRLVSLSLLFVITYPFLSSLLLCFLLFPFFLSSFFLSFSIVALFLFLFFCFFFFVLSLPDPGDCPS